MKCREAGVSGQCKLMMKLMLLLFNLHARRVGINQILNAYMASLMQDVNKIYNDTNEYKIIVLTTIKSTEKSVGTKITKHREVTGTAKSTTRLDAGDILVLFGEFKDINRLIKTQ